MLRNSFGKFGLTPQYMFQWDEVIFLIYSINFCEEDLRPLQQTIDREVLHILSLNEHFPRAVLHSSQLYGGIGCSTIHGQHVVEKILLFLHHV